MPTLLETAQSYIVAGLSVLDVDAKTKKPAASWDQFKETPMTTEQAAARFPRVNALALICGAGSGNLLCIDFDTRAHFLPRFEALAEEVLPGISKRVVRQRTQNGGEHWVFRVNGERRRTRKLAFKRIAIPDGIVGATYLWDGSRPDEPPHLRPETSREKGITAKLGADGKVYVCPLMIETRGESVDDKGAHPAYFLAAPSPGYTLTQGDFLHLPVLEPTEADALIAAAASLDEAHDLTGTVAVTGESRANVREGEILPGDVVNSLASVSAILEHHGGTIGPVEMKQGTTIQRWTRPGKDAADGISGTIYADAILHNFTSSVPELDQDTNYDAFGLIVRLDYGGNFTAATAALAEKGLPAEYAKDGQHHVIDCTPTDEHLAALQDKLLVALAEVESPSSGAGCSAILGGFLRRVARSILRNGQKEVILRAVKDATKISLATLKKELRKHEKEFEASTGLTDLFSHMAAAKATIDSYGPKNLLQSCGDFYVWKEGAGVWKKVEAGELANRAQQMMQKQSPESITGPAVESVVKVIKNEVRVEEGCFNNIPNAVNCLNGTLFLDEETGDWDFRQHRKEDMLTVQLPVRYNPDAKAARFSQFLDETFAGEADAKAKAQVILQFLGYTLLPTAKYEMFFIATGVPGSGKSKVAGVVQDLLGKENFVAVMPEQFSNKFQRAQLHGKLANIITELPEGHVLPDGDFKNTISGEPVTAEHKGLTPFTFNPFCSLWICTNHLPHTRDFSGGIFRRAILLRFNNAVPADKRDVNLQQKLKKEMSGILNMALAAYSGVVRQGKFTIPASTTQEIREWGVMTNQVEQFIDVQCVKEPAAKTRLKQAYRIFTEWAKSEGLRNVVASKGFAERVRALGFECGKNDHGYMAIRGLRVKPYVPDNITEVGEEEKEDAF